MFNKGIIKPGPYLVITTLLLLIVVLIPDAAHAKNSTANSEHDKILRMTKDSKNYILFAKGGLLCSGKTIRLDKDLGKKYALNTKPGMYAKFEEYKELAVGSTEISKGVTVDIQPVSEETWQDNYNQVTKIVAKWEESYFNPDVLDGMQWLLVVCKDGSIAEYSGSNDFPENWTELTAYLGAQQK